MQLLRKKKKVDFMITAFRDGFQSVYGARVFTKDFIPAVEAARNAGISHFEMGGGARFQSLYFYCNEDAFEMMDTFRQVTGPDANLQTLARGSNVVGLESQPRDIVKLHAKLFRRHGVTTIRNFDALNDINNLSFSGQCIADAGLKHEICISMMGLPPGGNGAHTPEFYAATLRQILDSGVPFHSLCFKDASGTSFPSHVHRTIKESRKLVGPDMRIVFHSHDTAGTCTSTYMAALDAGADQIDLSMAPVSGGTCQPDLLTMWQALRDSEYDLDIDVNKVVEAQQVFKECMKDYSVPPEALAVQPLIPFFPMPGGALTANTEMLRDNDMMDRYQEIIEAMGEAVALGGFGTSVTPVSQFYFQQAFNNVLFGKWKKIAEGYGKMVLGYFGRTPTPPDPKVVRLAREQLNLPPTTENPLDINDRDPDKGVEAARQVLLESGIEPTEENVFIAATCKEKGITFLKGEARVNVRKKAQGKEEDDSTSAPSGDPEGRYVISVNGHDYVVNLNESSPDTAVVDGQEYRYRLAAAGDGDSAPPKGADAQPAGASTTANTHRVTAPLPGIVLRLPHKSGSAITKGEVLLVLESMKMETPVAAPVGGILSRLAVNAGDQVKSGQTLAVIQEN